MSTIDRLSISGVRSFAPAPAQVVKIFTPLTLICGQNGTGKTTIIEALRYVTTGELPPNSAVGGAWLHDPKLTGTSQTLADVKLSFNTPTGQYMVVSRKMELTVKKATRSQRTLECQLLQRNPNGERAVISSRVAELDSMIPKYLGVSKAILDAVIFCHQDDSLWAMGPSNALKKRFDEIFEAHKYAKAIDNIKAIRKAHAEELQKVELEATHAKEDKAKDERMKQRMQELIDEMADLREKRASIRAEIDQVIKKSEVAYNMAAKFSTIVGETESKQLQATTLQDRIDDISTNMRKMNQSDDELRQMQNEFQKHVDRLESEKSLLTTQYTTVNDEIINLRSSLGRKQTEIGKLQSDMQRYENQIESRNHLIEETAKLHNIWDIHTDIITEDIVKVFMNDLRKISKDQQTSYVKAQKQTQTELKDIQQELNSLNQQQLVHSHTKQNCRSKIDDNDTKIKNFRSKMNKINIDHGTKAIHETHVKNMETQLKLKKDELEKADLNKKLEDLFSQINLSNDRKERLEREQEDASKMAAELGQLEYLTKEVKDKENSLEANSKSYDKQLKDLLSSNWTLSNLEELYDSVLNKKSEALVDAEMNRDRLIRDLEQCQDQIKEFNNDLNDKQIKLKEAANVITEVTEEEPEEFPKYLETTETDLSNLTADVASFSSRKEYYESCMKFANTHKICRLCERSFKANEQSKFISRLKKLLEDKTAEELQNQLKYLEDQIVIARNTRSTYDLWIKLQKEEIPLLEKNKIEAEQRKETLIQQLEEVEQSVKNCKNAKFDIESLSKGVQNLVKTYSDIEGLKAQLSEVESKQKGSGSSRASSIIQEDMKKVNLELKQLMMQQDEARTSREQLLNQIATFEIDLRDENAKLSNVSHQLKDKASIEQQISELRNDSEEQTMAIKKADEELESLNPKISHAQDMKEDISDRRAILEQDLAKDLSRTKESIQSLETASKEINQFIKAGGPKALETGSQQMMLIQDNLEKLDNDLKQIGRKVNKVEDELRDNDNTKRAISDNLSYREYTKTLIILREEIEELQSNNAIADKKKYTEEAESWNQKRNNLNAEQASFTATIKSKDEQFLELKNDWERDYKNASTKHRKAQIKATITKAAVEDLAKYATALDKAIMKYHSLKMSEINNTIQTLWRETYKGSDVDTIMIRSEHETAKANKSYNYRVVMVKQNTEMDMRGRCSAGQKVLACIIIRLALAECFSVNCGMIALDEPTTNLDRENIIALARSLNQLIKARRHQRNFQLIIITHDEDFLRYMNCQELTDDYFRIARNIHQKSEIKSQKISAI